MSNPTFIEGFLDLDGKYALTHAGADGGHFERYNIVETMQKTEKSTGKPGERLERVEALTRKKTNLGRKSVLPEVGEGVSLEGDVRVDWVDSTLHTTPLDVQSRLHSGCLYKTLHTPKAPDSV